MLDVINKNKTYGKYDLVKDLNDEIDSINDDIINENFPVDEDSSKLFMEANVAFKKELIKQILAS